MSGVNARVRERGVADRSPRPPRRPGGRAPEAPEARWLAGGGDAKEPSQPSADTPGFGGGVASVGLLADRASGRGKVARLYISLSSNTPE